MSQFDHQSTEKKPFTPMQEFWQDQNLTQMPFLICPGLLISVLLWSPSAKDHLILHLMWHAIGVEGYCMLL